MKEKYLQILRISTIFQLYSNLSKPKDWMSVKQLLLVGSLLNLTTNGLCQTDLPKIVQPSPETAALFKYQDYPLDYSTGVPQISIPIYEVKSGSLSVPVSMSYHASGRRVSDVDGPISVGWNLNAGGMISRTVYGSEDFGVFPFPNPLRTTNIHPVNDLPYQQEIFHSEAYLSPGYFKDSEYDIFSYSMNNLNGKFIFKDNNGIKTSALMPHKPYIVKPLYSGTGLNGIEITDDKGVFYSFSAKEIYNAFSGKWAYTGYSLMKIISADKADTISFKYTIFMQTRTSISKQWVVDDTPNSIGGPPYGYSSIPIDSENKNTDNYQVARLTEIDFNQGKVVFNLLVNSDRIDNVQIFNKDNDVIKTVQLSRSVMNTMSDGNPPANKLDEVIFKDKTGKSIERYSIEYFPIALPYGTSNMDLRHCDYWGYYNASGVNSMVPRYTNVPFQDVAASYTISVGDLSTNRAPNLDALKSGVLKKITFPTGGTAEFNYENNWYLSLLTNQVTLGPGLRVSDIITNDNNGTINSRTFKYGDGDYLYTKLCYTC